MKILIISTNRNQFPVAVMPLGACLVAQSTEHAGHNVRMLDLMFAKNPLQAIEDELLTFSPDLIGLSIRNIDNNDIQSPVLYPEELKPIVQTIKRVTKVPIVIGGAAVGIMPEAILRLTGADWAIAGSGVKVFPEFIAAIEIKISPKHIPGLAWIENGKFRKNSINPSIDFGQCTIPDFPRWLDIKKYISRLSPIPIQSKRGCPFDCIYCTYAMSEGPIHQVYSPQSVVDAIENYTDRGFKNIEFVDNVFNAPYEHALAVCRGLAELRPRANLQSLELSPKYIDDTLLTAMERAGFSGMGITPESASDSVLANLQKGFTSEHVRQTAKCVSRHSIPCVWIFMLGGPGETVDTVQQTFDFAQKYIHPRDIAFFGTGIRIYPGTPLEKIAREQKVLNVPPADMLKPVFYISPEISVDWLLDKIKINLANHHNFLDTTSLSQPIVPWIYTLAYRLGVKPPIWRHTRVLRRTLRFFGMNV